MAVAVKRVVGTLSILIYLNSVSWTIVDRDLTSLWRMYQKNKLVVVWCLEYIHP